MLNVWVAATMLVGAIWLIVLLGAWLLNINVIALSSFVFTCFGVLSAAIVMDEKND